MIAKKVAIASPMRRLALSAMSQPAALSDRLARSWGSWSVLSMIPMVTEETTMRIIAKTCIHIGIIARHIDSHGMVIPVLTIVQIRGAMPRIRRPETPTSFSIRLLLLKTLFFLPQEQIVSFLGVSAFRGEEEHLVHTVCGCT